MVRAKHKFGKVRGVLLPWVCMLISLDRSKPLGSQKASARNKILGNTFILTKKKKNGYSIHEK